MADRKKATKIFLVRGLARETRHWGIFLPTLANSFPDSNVHPFEVPGTGKLRNQTSPTSIDDYVKALRQQYLNNTAENDDCKIIGLSLGGIYVANVIDLSRMKVQRISPFSGKKSVPVMTWQVMISPPMIQIGA